MTFYVTLGRRNSGGSSFSQEDAEDIAYASEYVDDALEFMPMQIIDPPDFAKELLMSNGEFDVVCTAHDEDTMLGGALISGQERTYVPFHFVPRDNKSVLEQNFDYRTAPDCRTAKALVDEAIRQLNDAKGEQRSRKLIKLGIALHTYADTWAHKDFSGLFQPEQNSAANIQVKNNENWSDVDLATAPALVPETGHAKVHGYPDSSHTHWSYYNGVTREYFERDNPKLYLEAAKVIFMRLCEANGKNVGDKKVRDEIELFWKKKVEDAVDKCIKFTPKTNTFGLTRTTNIWEEGGLKQKIKAYLQAFPEIFTKSEEEEEYNELLWKSKALKPFVGEGGNKQYFDFKDERFDIKHYSKQLTKDIVDKLNGAWAVAVVPGVIPGLVAATVASAVVGIVGKLQSLLSMKYERLTTNSLSNKWFYFHVEAAAQRQFVLENTYLKGYVPEDAHHYISKLTETLGQQLNNGILNALEKFVAQPAKTLTGKAHWMTVEIQNDTPYEIVWTGHYRGDFALSGGSGRYWDRPDKPGKPIKFSVCERDNAVTGCCGVASFELRGNGLAAPFCIGFSNPVYDDALHAAKDVGGDIVNTPTHAWNLAGKVAKKALDVDLPKAGKIIDVKNDPKCRVSFDMDRQHVYDALNGDAKNKNNATAEFSDASVMLTAHPGQQAKVFVSAITDIALANVYQQRYPDVARSNYRIGGDFGYAGPKTHYDKIGRAEGRSWSAENDDVTAELYWSCYPDVAKHSDWGRSGTCGKYGAMSHYQLDGKNEHRFWGDLSQQKAIAEAYWKRYPDVSSNSTFGRNGPMGILGAWNHYDKGGKNEYRFWDNLPSWAENIDDVAANLYWTCYPDVAKHSNFGRNGSCGKHGAMSHYQLTGKNEHRFWDGLSKQKEIAEAYWRCYPDVGSHLVFGRNGPMGISGAWNHYNQQGRNEHRFWDDLLHQEECAKKYWDANSDVAGNPQYGRNGPLGIKGAWNHYNEYGRSEGRACCLS